jgi:hypothetical protein
MLTRGLAGLSEFVTSLVEKLTRGLGIGLASQCLLLSQFKLVYTPAYQLSSFLLYVCLYAKLLHMSAANSVINISLYLSSLEQSFIWACYMPALYANNSISYLRLSIYYCKQVALSSYTPIGIPATVL